MNYRLISNLLGKLLIFEAAILAVPLAVSLLYRSGDAEAFMWSMIIIAAVGGALWFVKPGDRIFRLKDAFAAAALSWIAFSLFGALPFVFSDCFEGVVDCIFESVSGFSTTGATILPDVESLPRGIQFWRCFTHWIGGMGVIVFMLAVLPSMNASSIHLLRAESTGPSPDRVVPRLRETARAMYFIYLTLSGLLVVYLLIARLPLYDALITTFSTAGTGGFSGLNASLGGYGNFAAEVGVTVFMLLFGVSFSIYFFAIKGGVKQMLRDEELRLYGATVTIAIILITIDTSGIYKTVGAALRHSAFQVSAVISTTGFSTADFTLWPSLSQFILLFLTFAGASAGSTGGGFKLVRILILFRSARVEIHKILHPKSVKVIMLNGKKVPDDVVTRTAALFFIYFTVVLAASLIVSLDGKDALTTMTSVVTTLSNVGPGLGDVGPANNFSEFSALSKIVFSFCMIAGRLELYPALVLFTPAMWRSK